MPAITLNEITYVMSERFVDTPGRIRRKVTVSFPTGANAATNNQYVTGGVPLSPLALACPNKVQRLSVIGFPPIAGNNNPRWIWNGNTTAPTLVGFANNTAGAPDAELPNTTAFGGPQTLVLEVEGY